MSSEPKTDVWMPIYVGDLLADTLHLNTEQFGAFMLLLFHQWRKGHFSEEETGQISRLAGSAHLSASSSAKQELSRLLAPVLQLLGRDAAGLLFSRRADDEKQKWVTKKRVFVERARKGGEAKAKKYREEKAKKEAASSTRKEVLELCTSPSPEEQKQKQAPPTPPAAPGGAEGAQAAESESKAKPRDKAAGAHGKGPDGRNPAKHPSARATGKQPTVAPGERNGSHPSKTPAGQDRRFGVFQAEVSKFYEQQNPKGSPLEWIRSDRGALIDFLRRAPSMGLAQFRDLLRNRAASEVNPSSPPASWLRDLQEFADGPLDRFKKPRKVRHL